MARTSRSSDVETAPRTARPASKRSLSGSSTAAGTATASGSNGASTSSSATTTTAQSKAQLARICNKLVLRGAVSRKGAAYGLFMRVTLPEAPQAEPGARAAIHHLFPDTNVRLLSSSIDELTPSGAAPALSVSAARAATVLGLALGTDGSMSDDPATMPKISTANYCICLVVPPAAQPAKRNYIITLNLQVNLTAQPPRLPYIVTIPMPRCLNNRMHMTLADSACTSDDGVVVEVDPPLLPHAARRRTSLEEEEDEAGVVTGPFPATEAVVVRWAAQDAARTPALPLSAAIAAAPARGDRLSSLRADALTTTLHVSAPLNPPADLAHDEVALGVELHGKLEGAHFAALDSESVLLLTVDAFAQRFRWVDADVTGSKALLRWAPVWGNKAATHVVAPSSSTNSEASSSSDTSPELEAGATLEEDDEDGALLDVAPPRGMDMADLSYSFDSSLTPQRRRRHSIGAKKHADEKGQETESADAVDAGTNGVVLVLKTSSVCGRNGKPPSEPFTFTLRGMLVVSTSAAPLPGVEGASISLPLFRAPSVEAHTCAVHIDTPPPGSAAFELLRSPQAARSPVPSPTLSEDAPLFTLGVSNEPLPNRPPPGHGFDAEDCVLTFRPAEGQAEEEQVKIERVEKVEEEPSSPISHVADADLSTASAVSTATVLMHAAPNTPPTAELMDGLGGGIVASATLDVWPSVTQPKVTPSLLDTPTSSASQPMRVVHRFDATWPCSLPSSTAFAGDSVGKALSCFVVALPGTEAEVMHASIGGKPVRYEVTQQVGGASCIVELTLPLSASTHGDEPPRVSLMYATKIAGDAGAKEVPLPLVSSTIAALEVRVHLPQPSTFRVLCASLQASASNEASGVVRFQTFMQPAMATRLLHLEPLSILTLRAPRTPLTSAITPTARAARQSSNKTLVWLVLSFFLFGTLCFLGISNHLLDLRQDLYRVANTFEPFGAGAGAEEAPDGWYAMPGVYRRVPACVCKDHSAGSGAGAGAGTYGPRQQAEGEEIKYTTNDKKSALMRPRAATPQEYKPRKRSALGLILYSPVYLLRATGGLAHRLFTRLFGGGKA